jgi:excisionase family DNA binding protein
MEKQADLLPLLTLHEAAKLLNLPIHSVRNMIRSKKLRAFKVGGQWRIRRSEITKWVQPNREA